MLTLIGVAIVVIGFVLRMNPLMVVTVAGLATGIASGLGPLAVVAAFGKAFITSRYVAIVWLVLPVIGLLEHAGLKERARSVVSGLRAATVSRVLLAYFAIRQITAALGSPRLADTHRWCDPSSRRWRRAPPRTNTGAPAAGEAQNTRSRRCGRQHSALFR